MKYKNYILLLLLAVAGPIGANSVETLWTSGPDYVRLESIEGAGVSHDHPINLSVDQVSAIMRNLQVSREQDGGVFSWRDEEPKLGQVFSEQEIKKVSGYISEAFSKASPNQDVTLSVSSRYGTTLGGALEETLSTTARMFVDDGRMQVIVGELNVAYRDKYEQRGRHLKGTPIDDVDYAMQPLPPGDRRVSRADGWQLMEGGAISLRRLDWAAVDLNMLTSQHSAVPQQVTESAGETATTPALSPLETEVAPDQHTKPQADHSVGTGVKKDAVERKLRKLLELKNKGLIPEEIYIEEVKKAVSRIR